MKKLIIAVIASALCLSLSILSGCNTAKGTLDGASEDITNAATDVSKAIPS